VSEEAVGSPVPSGQTQGEGRTDTPANHSGNEQSPHPRRVPSRRSEIAVVASARVPVKTIRSETSTKPGASTISITIIRPLDPSR
jgi:hypothetical protein